MVMKGFTSSFTKEMPLRPLVMSSRRYPTMVELVVPSMGPLPTKMDPEPVPVPLSTATERGTRIFELPALPRKYQIGGGLDVENPTGYAATNPGGAFMATMSSSPRTA